MIPTMYIVKKANYGNNEKTSGRQALGAGVG